MSDPSDPFDTPTPQPRKDLPETSALASTILEGLGTAGLRRAPDGGESTRWIGRYRLVEVIGEGGFGIVWKAEQEEPVKREVALKVVKAGMANVDILARFAAERQALTVMEHPNIAALLDAGQTDEGHPFFVMPLVRGRPITKYCDEERLDVRRRLELFADVCEAVEHAHRRGVLHRDLKPSNILVEEVDGKATARVIDFGIAKMIGDDAGRELGLTLTGKGMVIGTPQYMSPEQASSHPDIDTRSDVYALGAVLYELLTGSPPLESERLKKAAWDEVLRLIRENEVERPSSRLIPLSVAVDTLAARRQTTGRRLADSVRGELDWIVLRALEKDRERRYAGASALSADIVRYLNGEPVVAGPPSGTYRLKKYLRRHWLPVSAAAAVAVSLVGGGALSLWQWQVARKAEGASRNSLHTLVGVEIAESVRRGDAVRTLELLGEAQSAGYPDHEALLFYEIEARVALSDPLVPTLLDSLDAAQLSPIQRPRLLYWRGERLVQDGKTKEGQELLRAALDQGLPQPEHSLARGLLSETASEALEHYQMAASLAPQSTVAQRNLVVALLLSGHIAEARSQIRLAQSLIPETRDFYVLSALLEAFQQRPQEALAALERLPEGSDSAQELFAPLLEPLSQFSSGIVLGICGNDPQVDFMGQWRLSTAVGRFTAAAGERGSPPGMLGVSPVLTRGVKGLVDGLWNYHMNQRDAAVQILRETLQSNDEGTLWAVLGAIEFNRHRYPEAAEAFQRAQNASSLIRNVGNAAVLMEGAAEAANYWVLKKPGSLERAGAAFLEAFESDLPPEAFKSILQSSLPQRISLKLPDRMLARRIAARMAKDSAAQLSFMAKIEYAEANRVKAQQIADRAAALFPEDPALRELASSIRAGTLEVPIPDPPANESGQ